MRDQLMFICAVCETIHSELDGQHTITRKKSRYIQILLDEIQSALDDISNEMDDLGLEDDDYE